MEENTRKDQINKFYSFLEGRFGSKEIEDHRQKINIEGENITITYRDNNYDFSLDGPEDAARAVANWWDKHLMDVTRVRPTDCLI